MRGEPLPPLDPPDTGLVERLRTAAAFHGVGPLVYDRLRATPIPWARPSDPLMQGLRADAHGEAAGEWIRMRDLVAVLDRLHDAGIPALLLKGTPLAYALYDAPHLRPRGDTDILVPAASRASAQSVLQAAGYRAQASAGGRLASYQMTFQKPLALGAHQVIDLHWQISNAQVYAQAIDFEPVWAEARPVPPLGPNAWMLGLEHALLLACMHRANHLESPYYFDGVPYREGNRLIWLYDIQLLARRFTRAHWDRFLAIAGATRMRAVCLDGLEASETRLATPVPDSVRSALAAPGPPERSAHYLRANRWWTAVTDVRALPRWRDRMTLLREWCLPPADYMLRKYHTRARWRLPWLYLRRAIGGVVRAARAGHGG